MITKELQKYSWRLMVLVLLTGFSNTHSVYSEPNNMVLAWSSSGDDQPGARYGWSVASAGDVNGDGYSDVIIGAWYTTSYGCQGKVYVYLGSSAGFAAEPAWTSSCGEDVIVGSVGHSVSSAGDVNGDGYDDIIVGAPGVWGGPSAYCTDPGCTGMAYVFLGSPTGLESLPSWSSAGEAQGDAAFGYSVSEGDINGDGYDDVIIGAPSYDTGPPPGDIDEQAAGRAYLYLGSADGLETSPSWISSGDNQEGAFYGESVSGAGDVNGDGNDDVIVTTLYEGKAFLYLGSTSGLAVSPTWTSFVNSASFACDVNGDGYDDIIAGAAGKAFVYFGSAGGPEFLPGWSWELPDSDMPASIRLVSSAGDVNRDGYDDILVGDDCYSVSTAVCAGRVYLYFGSDDGPTLPAYWASLGDEQEQARYGWSASSAGDIDGDGHDDVLVGAWSYDTSHIDAGKAYLYVFLPDDRCTPDGSVCDDGNACTSNDICIEGVCTGDSMVSCDDSNPCTHDTCEPEIGCMNTATSGERCDDGNACTLDDTCIDGACTGSSTVSCDDSNPCTDDICDPAIGCINTVTPGKRCDDGDQSTIEDNCNEDGICTGIKKSAGCGCHMVVHRQNSIQGEPRSSTRTRTGPRRSSAPA
jgi:hypothetical protein